MISINQKIVGWSVPKPTPETATVPQAPLLAVIDRPAKLHGTTYKIRPPMMSAALYITINDAALPDGSRRPLEIFLNTKDTTHFQWMVAVTRLLSSIFRYPLPFEFAIDELKQVHDPHGSYFIPGSGGICGGIVAHIAKVLETHCIENGMITAPQLDVAVVQMIEEKKAEAKAIGAKGQRCAKCGEDTVYVLDGCTTCVTCADSKCS